MMEKTSQKFVNMYLAQMLEQALKAKRDADMPSRATRDKAIRRAIAVTSARVYNEAVKMLGPLGSSKIAQEQELLVRDWLVYDKPMGFVTDDEIERIIAESYPEVNSERKQINKIKQAEAIATIAANPRILDLLTKIADNKRSHLKDAARKGGLVTKYMSAGADKDQANQMAEDTLREETVKQHIAHVEHDPAMQAAIAQVLGEDATSEAQQQKEEEFFKNLI